MSVLIQNVSPSNANFDEYELCILLLYC